jgi:hypothetical protein
MREHDSSLDGNYSLTGWVPQPQYYIAQQHGIFSENLYDEEYNQGSYDLEDELTLDLQAMFQPQQQLYQNSVTSQ